jgi:hypothetical protein
VANYNVDIELAVKNLNTIKALKKELDSVEKALQRISKLDTFDPSGFRARTKARQDEKNQIKDQIRLTNDLRKAESARRAELLRGVRLERQQRLRGLEQYSGPIGPGPASPVAGRIRQMQEVQQLTKAAFAAYTKLTAAAKAHDNNVTKIELANDDIVFKQKLAKIDALADAELATSKATNDAALKDFDRRLENRAARRKGSLFGQATTQQRAGAAVSAGAFPLLFGGGPGMAIGGAIGGAVTGSTFGPASIALQVLGGFFDELAAKAATLGQALNLATADVDAIVESLGVVGSPIQDAIQSIEELAGEQAALEAATSQLALVVGDEGVEALTAFGDASTRFGNALTQVTTQILAQIARLTGPVVKEIATSLEISGLLSAAKASTDPRQVALQAKLAAQPVQAGAKGMPSLERVKIEREMVEIQRKIREEEEGKLQAQVERLRAGSAERVIAENNLAIAQLDGDLTNKRVFDLEKANIFQEARQKMLKDGADIKLIELERNTKLLALENKRNDLINTATEKASKTSDRLEKQKQRAIEREIKAVDRQLERADKAFNRADEQLDKIIQKHEDKMAFEREYAELIRNGSTPAAAQQAIELKKQLLELDRNFAKQEELLQQQLKSVELSIAKARAEGATTEALQDQIDKLEEIKNKIEGLPGKKDKAEGAIGEALAPKSDRQRVLDYMDELQGKINDMMDPVNQLISLSEAFGSAFTESFKGVVSGSMTAREALANLFQRTADHFLDMAAQMIAAQIKMQILGIGLNFLAPGVPSGFSPSSPDIGGTFGVTPKTAGINFSGAFSGKALGGAVGAGTPYLVGEKGPELFVPGAQGNIVPNNAMGGSNIVVNVDASGSSVQGDGQQAKALGQAIGAAVKAEIVKQKMPGGLLF